MKVHKIAIFILIPVSLMYCDKDQSKRNEKHGSEDIVEEKQLASAEKAPGQFIYGVTITSPNPLNQIIDSLENFQQRPFARLVFDEFVPATDYFSAVENISKASQIMGEILDSFYVKQYTAELYQKRVEEYFTQLHDKDIIWEVGNEANGEWLGAGAANKFVAAYDYISKQGGRTALTLYYNQGCWANENNEMFKWADGNIPARMKNGLEYVWISYYEEDCEGLRPDWSAVFTRLSLMFPNSKVGFGECGTKNATNKGEFIDRYYKIKPSVPNFVGGYFWWYFNEDMVPRSKPLWATLNRNFVPLDSVPDINDSNP